jgi:hypothetical protein
VGFMWDFLSCIGCVAAASTSTSTSTSISISTVSEGQEAGRRLQLTGTSHSNLNPMSEVAELKAELENMKQAIAKLSATSKTL